MNYVFIEKHMLPQSGATSDRTLAHPSTSQIQDFPRVIPREFSYCFGKSLNRILQVSPQTYVGWCSH